MIKDIQIRTSTSKGMDLKIDVIGRNSILLNFQLHRDRQLSVPCIL
jgi:hypothetical protein